jgi:hypothetical protein
MTIDEMSILDLNIFEHQENMIWASKTEIESSNKFWIDENWPSKPQSLELSYCVFEVLRSLTLNPTQISSEWTSKMRWKTTVLLDMILGNLSNMAEQASLVIHLFNPHKSFEILRFQLWEPQTQPLFEAGSASQPLKFYRSFMPPGPCGASGKSWHFLSSTIHSAGRNAAFWGF